MTQGFESGVLGFCSGFRVFGSGVGFWVLPRVWGLGFGVWPRVWGLGFGLGFVV